MSTSLGAWLRRVFESDEDRQAREDQEFLAQARSPEHPEQLRYELHQMRKAQRQRARQMAFGPYTGLLR